MADADQAYALNLVLERQNRHRKALTRLRPQRLKWRLLSEYKMSQPKLITISRP
jgi:hypothetical protein